jgi:phosphoribosylformylglycinamidine (FGAM) synthase PurS component
MNFLAEWGYYIQGAVYQKVVEINTGKKLPFYIAAVSKEKVPDIQLIACEQSLLNEALLEVESNIHRIVELKSGMIQPNRCEHCEYCKNTRVLD